MSSSYEEDRRRSEREELKRFKTEINLHEYAMQNYGYQLDKKKSSVNSQCLKGTNDKILVKQDNTSNNWIYTSLTNSKDKGSIIDFVQNRESKNLGEVRLQLRQILGKPRYIQPQNKEQKPIPREDIVLKLQQMNKDVTKSKFIKERGINPEILTSKRFKGTVLRDDRNNAVFPHKNKQGFCGIEKRNKDYKSFLKGGKKGLWASNSFKSDKYLFIAESPLDCMAHAQMNPNANNVRYIATSGSLTNENKKLLESAANRIRKLDGKVILGMDNDKAGHQMNLELQQLLKTNHVRVPNSKDWSEDLMKQQKRERDYQR